MKDLKKSYLLILISIRWGNRTPLTINPRVYQAFKEATDKRLQPKSWVIENMMKNYITETNK